MDSFASPSTRGDRPLYKTFGLLGTGALALLLGLSFLSVPGPPDAKLDASWQEMLLVARSQSLQFGRDIIFTWGPWGFLCSRFHLGSLEALPILIWQTAGQVLLALGLVTLTRSLALCRRLAFVAATLAFHWLFQDSVYFVLITLIGISGLMAKDSTLLKLALWAVVLGFLAQIKFTYFLIASAAAGCAIACALLRRSRENALVIALGFSGSVLGAWVAAGQTPNNLYPYLRRSLEITSGYGDAMGFDESWPVFLWGAALALSCALFIWRLWRTGADRALAPSAAAFLGFTLFVMWKESYTRADMVPLGGHVFGLFTFVMILGPVLPGLLFPGRRLHPFDGVLPVCLLGIACFDADYYRQGPRVAWERIYGNVHALARLGSLESEWQGQYETARQAAELPAIRAAVGRGTADVYDFNTGAAILNGLSLSTRPIFQGYSAYTPSLQGYNLRHYQSARAPDFLLWNDERVDNRYPGQDDAPLLARLPGHYDPLFTEGGYWLFRKALSLSKEPLLRRQVLGQSVRLSEEILLPTPIDHAVWLEADAVPTALGRLRSLLYKPAALNLATTDEAGRRSVWRLLPRTARTGFILVPTLASGGDLVALMHGEARSWVKSFHFEAPEGQEEFWSHIEVRVSVLPSLPIRPALPLPWLVELGLFDRPPIDVTSTETQQVIETEGGRALLVHADGRVDLAVPAGATGISFGYGLRDGSYSGLGHTEGVLFSLDAVGQSGRTERLWERYLDPVARGEDRGTQHVDLTLPADRPLRLVLRTGPGPRKDYRWDWSYVSAVRFKVPGAKGNP